MSKRKHKQKIYFKILITLRVEYYTQLKIIRTNSLYELMLFIWDKYVYPEIENIFHFPTFIFYFFIIFFSTTCNARD